MPYIYFEDNEKRVMVCEHLTLENKPIMDSICDACQYHRCGKKLICRYSVDELRACAGTFNFPLR